MGNINEAHPTWFKRCLGRAPQSKLINLASSAEGAFGGVFQ
jgi:hypothetical protein